MRRPRPALLLITLLAACSRASPPDAGASDGGTSLEQHEALQKQALGTGLVLVTEAEPNDSPETAQRLDGSRTVSGELQAVQPATRPDEDWYLIAPAQPQDVSIQLLETGGATSGGKFILEVYDRGHDRIYERTGSLDPDPTSPELAALPTLRVKDALYVRIAGQPFAYKLIVRLKPPDPGSEAEPNDRAVDATPLPLGLVMHGTYASESDHDYYAVELAPVAEPAPSDAGTLLAVDAGASDGGTAQATQGADDAGSPTEMLRIEVSGVPGVRQQVEILDEAQTPLAKFTSREAGEPVAVRDFALRPGLPRVYLLLETLRARKKNLDAGPPTAPPYTIAVHREPAPPDLELEPNDSIELATPLVAHIVFSPGAPPSAAASAMARRVGYLAPAGDVDDYRLHLDSPARAHVTLSALEAVATELSVVEPDASSASGKTILKVNEGGTKEAEVIPSVSLAAGDHIFRVQAAAHQVGTKWVRDQSDPDHTYELAIALMPDDGLFEREPNDSPALATSIAPGQTLSGYAFPAKDLDVYRLDLSNQPVAAGVTLRLSGVPKVPLELELREAHDGRFGELLNSSDPGKAGLDAQIQQKLDPAIYYLVVKPHPASRDPGVPQADAETPYRLSVQLE